MSTDGGLQKLTSTTREHISMGQIDEGETGINATDSLEMIIVVRNTIFLLPYSITDKSIWQPMPQRQTFMIE